MKKIIAGIALAAVSLIASAQLIYGNTFPFWNVNGPLTVTGLATLSGGTTLTGTTSLTSPAVTTSLTTPSTSFALLNTTATTLNVGGAATTVTLGAATGTVTIGPAVVGSIATDASSSTTGAWKTAGGLGVAKKLYVGTDVTVGGQFIVSTSATPLAADACTAGKIVWDASYIYVCTASGAWKRAAITGGY